MGNCGGCGAHLEDTDRFCLACDQPNVGGKLHPRFRSPLTDLVPPEPVVEIAVGTPICPRCGKPGSDPDRYCSGCGMSMRRAIRWGGEEVEGVWTTPGPDTLDAYRPLGLRSAFIRAFLLLGMLLSGVGVFAYVAYFTEVDPTLPSVPIINEVWSDWIVRVDTIMVGYGVCACLVAAWWTACAYRNLRPMQVRGLRFPAPLAWIGWLVPVVQLVLPKLFLNDLIRASAPTAGYRTSAWRHQPTPLAARLGWCALVIGVVLIPFSPVVAPEDPTGRPGQLRTALILGALGYLLVLAGLVVLRSLVEQITDRQSERLAWLGIARPRGSRLPEPEAEPAEAVAVGGEDQTLRRVDPDGPTWGRY